MQRIITVRGMVGLDGTGAVERTERRCAPWLGILAAGSPFYRDYRDVVGLKLPSTIEQRLPDSTMILKFPRLKTTPPSRVPPS